MHARVFLTLAACSALGCWTAQPAAAMTTVSFSTHSTPGGPESEYKARSSDAPDAIHVTYTARGFIFEDPSGVRGERCQRATATKLVCEQSISALLNLLGGRDRLEVSSSSNSPYGGPLLVTKGGRGADTMVGGADSDVFSGGKGSDLLRGRGGRDDLYGVGGRDRLYGGRSADSLEAMDGHRDLVIDCGPNPQGPYNNDYARVDAIDPVPVSCEHVPPY